MPETARTPQDRAEGLSGGAGKRCYGKYSLLANSYIFTAIGENQPKIIRCKLA